MYNMMYNMMYDMIYNMIYNMMYNVVYDMVYDTLSESAVWGINSECAIGAELDDIHDNYLNDGQYHFKVKNIEVFKVE